MRTGEARKDRQTSTARTMKDRRTKELQICEKRAKECYEMRNMKKNVPEKLIRGR